jgi:hypothetical protein
LPSRAPRENRTNYYKTQAWPEGMAEPWLKWDGETDDDYARFQCFRDLPPPRRTLDNAYIVHTGGVYAGRDRPALTGSPSNDYAHRIPSSWKKLQAKWHWRERAEKHDRWKEKTQLEAERDGTLQAWREMGERHAREAMALQQKALERLQTLNPRELSAAEVRQFLVQAATLERLARGASLQDMARVQREAEQEAAKEGVAVITYVDDWRGDRARNEARNAGRNPDSFYGNGQGRLPLPKPAPGTDGGDAPAAPVHLPRRRKKVAQDHPGDDAGR